MYSVINDATGEFLASFETEAEAERYARDNSTSDNFLAIYSELEEGCELISQF